jgi:eukaryotic-like serine/threonine-protein kinase
VANDDRDNDQLMELVSKIDDGQPIDWMSAELAAGTERERAVLAELRLLAALTQVSRNPDFHGAETLVEPITPPAGGFTQWGTLKVLELVGKGGFGRVYRAEDRLNRQVALKLFPLDRDGSGELVSRVLREGTLLARIKHPNVVVVHGVDLSGGYVGLWMEFVSGRTMEHELKSRGTLSAEEATSIGVDVCRALAAVHGRGILHRDVKAQNVMREQGGRTVLMDFGAGSESVGDSSGPVDVAGTPLYLAPELFEKQPATRASDIYSLGVLLYRMVTWSYPVDGADRSEIAKAHREGRRQRLRDARPDLPHGFVEVVERALARDPAERYQTAATFEEALTRWDHHSRFRWLRTAGALAAAVILVLGAAWLVRSRSSSPPIESLPASVVLPTPAAPAMAPYHVTATFYKPGDQERTLAPGDRVAPGDSLGLRLDASTAIHVYVLNVDDSGDNYLLFPLPGGMTNPLAAGQTHELPGRQGANRVYWKVTSAAGREHFLVLVSPTPVPAFEPLLRTLPSPTMGKPVMATPIPDSILGDLRGVGGLTSADGQKTASSTRAWFGNVEPLRAGAETVRGLWIRQITLENPAR